MHQKHFCCAKCINHVNLIIELFNEANRFKNVVGDHSIVFVHKEKQQQLRALMSARLQELFIFNDIYMHNVSCTKSCWNIGVGENNSRNLKKLNVINGDKVDCLFLSRNIHS